MVLINYLNKIAVQGQKALGQLGQYGRKLALPMGSVAKGTGTIALVLFLTGSSQPQEDLDKNYIITASLYNEHFESVNPAAESKIAAYLKNKSLSELVDNGVISRIDMRDFALPLGVHGSKKAPFSYQQGMIAMWNYKVVKNKIDVNRPALRNYLDALKLKAVERMNTDPRPMNLDTYRATVLKPVLDSIRIYHQRMLPRYSPERRAFMNIFMENFTANVLLGYNIHELIPATHFTGSQGELPVNPIFKTYYFDRLLQEGGSTFISYFPARHDTMLSFGPFQFTNIAFKDIQKNEILTRDFKVFGSVEELRTIEDHALAAVLFAYNNWERLSVRLNLNRGELLTRFNRQYYESGSEARRNFRIFVAGMTATMHHLPSRAMGILVRRIAAGESVQNLYINYLPAQDATPLRMYYRSAAEAYLYAKVHDKLFKG
ncbi:hypothetical protein GCM10023187_51940 [Nibrella viscosa]|uniref:Uncharacterized protein n=1 Tax=Nibrella viscosa TaxID=1084524 RepID=A0ABP8KY31_9BACT